MRFNPFKKKLVGPTILTGKPIKMPHSDTVLIPTYKYLQPRDAKGRFVRKDDK